MNYEEALSILELQDIPKHDLDEDLIKTINLEELKP